MNRKEKYLEIVNENVLHNFLDKKSILKCMEISYEMGIEDFLEWLVENNLTSIDKIELKDQWLKKINNE